MNFSVELPSISTNFEVKEGVVELKVTDSKPTGPCSYQWCKNDEEITNKAYPYITGEKTSVLQIKYTLDESKQYAGLYSCIVSNNAGSVISQVHVKNNPAG